jgi:hypothetical protein
LDRFGSIEDNPGAFLRISQLCGLFEECFENRAKSFCEITMLTAENLFHFFGYVPPFRGLALSNDREEGVDYDFGGPPDFGFSIFKNPQEKIIHALFILHL